jgi:hypothetical protein
VPTKEGSKLSLRDHCKIQCGIIETLLIVSCCNVHYRDLNIGNVLFEVRPVPNTGKQGTSRKATGTITGDIRGNLIDYGNARILDLRRKRLSFELTDPDGLKARLCLDDARSINAYFVSTRMLKVLELASEYRAQGEIVRSTEKAMKSRNPILVRKAKNQRNDAKKQQKLIAEQIDGLPHRYIDGMLTNYRPHSFRCSAMLTIPMPISPADIESALYVHIFQVSPDSAVPCFLWRACC